MSTPRVTVILSSLNHARFIGESIQSVLDQSFTDFELHVIDDASDDGSWDIISRFRDPRIRPVRNPRRMRAAAGFNRTIADLARGEFVAIHHSDDAWAPTKLEKQVALLEARPAVGAVFTKVAVIDERGAPFSDVRHPYFAVFDQANRTRHDWLRFFFTVGNGLCHPSVLARRRVMLDAGLYDRRLGQITDFDLWVRICLRHEIHILDEALTRFRILDRELNQSAPTLGTQIRVINEMPLVLERFLAIRDEPEFFAIFPEARATALPEGNHVGFLLAQRAIEVGAPGHVQFALATLYHLMAEPAACLKLRDQHSFGYAELIALTGQLDPSNQHELRRRQHDIDALKLDGARMRATLSWRLAAPFRFARRLLQRGREA